MKHWRGFLALTVLMALVLGLLPGTALAAYLERPGSDTVTLIVEMEAGSLIEQQSAARRYGLNPSDKAVTAGILREQKQVQQRIRRVNADAVPGYSYTAVFNGFSIEAAPEDVAAIKALPGVENVYLARRYRIPAPVTYDDGTDDVEVDVEPSSYLTGVDMMHDAGFRGEGMVIAIVDSEIDTGHEFLSGSVDGVRLSQASLSEAIASQELSAGDVGVSQVWKSEKIPFAYNYTNGSSDTFSADPDIIHGTHVAGIAAGKNGALPDGGRFDGVAPEAQLLAMACPDLRDDYLVAAIDDAVKLGADVINMSWGSDYEEESPNAEYFTYGEVFSNARQAGVYLVNAAGNSSRGFYELFTDPAMPDYGSMGSPGVGGYTTNVASADNISRVLEYCVMEVNGESLFFVDQNIDQEEIYSFAEAFSDTACDYVYCGDGQDVDPSALELTGKIAVFDRGSAYFSDRVDIAIAANAAGAVFILNEEDDLFDTYVAAASMRTMPVATVDYAFREVFTDTPEGSLITYAETIREPYDLGYTDLSYFSSWGVFHDLSLSPEITAPGGYIWSSLPDKQVHNKYATMSGTSMAAPHLSGVVALVKQALLTVDEARFSALTAPAQVAEIEARMMSTAQLLIQAGDTDEDTGYFIPYSPRNQGAGLVHAVRAVLTPAVLLGPGGRAKIELGDELGDSFTVRFTVRNYGSEALTLYPDLNVFTDGISADYQIKGAVPLEVEFTPATAIVAPPETDTEVTLTVTLDSERTAILDGIFPNGFYLDGYVLLYESEEMADGPALSIPFMGFHGDWTAAPVLDAPAFSEDAVLGLTNLGSGFPDTHDVAVDEDYGYYYDTCIPLGWNVLVQYFLSYEEYEALDPSLVFDREEFAGVSPNGDDAYDYLCVTVMPLRYAETAGYYIYDADGNEVLSYTEDEDYGPLWLDRFLPNSVVFEYDDLKDLPEGAYTAVVTARFNEKAAEESVEMPFYIDNTEPEITDFTVTEEDGTTYLDVTVADNGYLMGAILYEDVEDEDAYMAVRVNAGDSEASYRFDITGMDIRHLVFEADDYAYNAVVQPLADLTMNVTAPVFPAVEADYVQPEAKAIRIENAGNVDFTIDDVTVSGEAFTVVAGDPAVPMGETNETYLIRPVAGLHTGIYKETVTVHYENGETATAQVQFTVRNPASPGTPGTPGTPSGPVDPGTPAAGGFVDVPRSEYYYNAVRWAVDEGITTGTSDTTFSPNDNCTRAQMVTFLWRAAGEPAPKTSENPFTDVREKDYFYEAVLWAVEEGITNGTSSDKFSPNDTVTRAQSVTMIYRSAGEPSVDGAENPFRDVSADSYAYNAILWAVETGVTNGTSSTRFSPEDDCLRGQIVTFLYRYYEQ